MVERESGIWSGDTGIQYENYDALVAAEASGWGAFGVSKDMYVMCYGPYKSKREAQNARIRLRRQLREAYNDDYFKTWVRPIWRDVLRVR